MLFASLYYIMIGRNELNLYILLLYKVQTVLNKINKKNSYLFTYGCLYFIIIKA